MRIANPPASGIEGIALRQLEAGDCAAWFDYLRLPEVFEHTSWNLRSVDDLRGTMESCLQQGPTAQMRMAVIDVAAGRLVGTIGLHTLSEVNRSAERGYRMVRGRPGDFLMFSRLSTDDTGANER